MANSKASGASTLEAPPSLDDMPDQGQPEILQPKKKGKKRPRQEHADLAALPLSEGHREPGAPAHKVVMIEWKCWVRIKGVEYGPIRLESGEWPTGPRFAPNHAISAIYTDKPELQQFLPICKWYCEPADPEEDKIYEKYFADEEKSRS